MNKITSREFEAKGGLPSGRGCCAFFEAPTFNKLTSSNFQAKGGLTKRRLLALTKAPSVSGLTWRFAYQRLPQGKELPLK